MKGGCPCGRACADCVYHELCGGCIEDACVHVRERESHPDRSREKCLFCEMKGIDRTCPTLNPPPPKELNCPGPWVLKDIVAEWRVHRDERTAQPPEPSWPLLIPEVSDITETTSRLGVWPDEGNWRIRKWNPIAWDMTGYLFDKIQGAPWVREPETNQVEDWHFILGSDESWIKDILFVDRLPDRLAMQVPPSAMMVAYLNRLYSYQPGLLFDDDAPTPWLLSHGYPSYIDWPPAWHWNLGIRMLSSLAAYVGSMSENLVGSAAEETWYPDLTAQITVDLEIPHVDAGSHTRLLWTPGVDGPYRMDWERFPGIVPFVPGADTNQISWFTKQIVSMGYSTVALDAVNSIAHEDFKALSEAVATVIEAGAKHVMVYGPWPLHPPAKYVPVQNVSYIPAAVHMNMTNHPARFWRRTTPQENREERQWKRLPNYRRVALPEVVSSDETELCRCPACEAASRKESDPRSIWRWGHLLNAAEQWEKRVVGKKARAPASSAPEKNMRLWYQGPSYTVFRKCLHYPPEVQWKGIEDILQTLVFTETSMQVKFEDGASAPAWDIRWTWWDEGHHWDWEFPSLED